MSTCRTHRTLARRSTQEELEKCRQASEALHEELEHEKKKGANAEYALNVAEMKITGLKRRLANPALLR